MNNNTSNTGQHEQPAAHDTTRDYLDRAEVGTIVAFKAFFKGKHIVLSGKILEKGPSGIAVETKNGTRFSIMDDDVIWVKTGARWPSWVFEQLVRREHHDEA